MPAEASAAARALLDANSLLHELARELGDIDSACKGSLCVIGFVSGEKQLQRASQWLLLQMVRPYCPAAPRLSLLKTLA